MGFLSKAKLIKKEEAVNINLGTKRILKYTSQDRSLEINHMFMSGRQPEREGLYNLESLCHFMVYVLKGSGTFYVEDEVINIGEGDVLDISANTKFATEGDFEYLAFESPAFTLEQASIVDIDGNIIEEVKE